MSVFQKSIRLAVCLTNTFCHVYSFVFAKDPADSDADDPSWGFGVAYIGEYGVYIEEFLCVGNDDWWSISKPWFMEDGWTCECIVRNWRRCCSTSCFACSRGHLLPKSSETNICSPRVLTVLSVTLLSAVCTTIYFP